MGSRRIYRRLIDVGEALEALERLVRLEPRGVEEVDARHSLGRVLAEDVRAGIHYPPFTRSLVDGYAVLHSDTEGAYEDRPVKLRLVGSVRVGERPGFELRPGECAEVSTGAALPYPADAVVPVEYTRVEGGVVHVFRGVGKGENVDYVGSDAVEGEVIAVRGSLVTPQLLAAMLAAGVDKVRVYVRPRVAVIPVGNELAEPGSELEYGRVYESNSYMICGMIERAGGLASRYPIVRDDYGEIRAAVDEALSESDVVVTIGGTSAGAEDLVYRVFEGYSPGVVVHGLKVTPGRPTVIALAGDKILVGLPGFPVSCANVARLVLMPIVRRLAGLRGEEGEPAYSAELAAPVRGLPSLKRVIPVVLGRRGGRVVALPLPYRSGSIVTFTHADGLAVVPEGVEYLPEGSRVEVYAYGRVDFGRTLFMGSHCPLAMELLRRAGARVIVAGSLHGLTAVGRGVADVAGSHLYDEESGEYNWPLIPRYGYRGLVVVRGYVRRQGFIFRRGLGVESLGDIAERGLRFVNRNRGSGTRALIERLVREEAERLGEAPSSLKRRIRGFEYEVRTHEAVGYLISRGVADVGVGVEYVAHMYGLEFKWIADEVYDFIVKRESLGKAGVERLLELLRPENLEELLTRYPGYELHPETGKVIYEC